MTQQLTAVAQFPKSSATISKADIIMYAMAAQQNVAMANHYNRVAVEAGRVHKVLDSTDYAEQVFRVQVGSTFQGQWNPESTENMQVSPQAAKRILHILLEEIARNASEGEARLSS